jgi:hypothetical protein
MLCVVQKGLSPTGNEQNGRPFEEGRPVMQGLSNLVVRNTTILPRIMSMP